MSRCSFGSSRSFLAAAALVVASSQANAVLNDTFDPATVGATATQSAAAPGPTVTGGGPTGNFLRLINDGINGQANHYAYTRSDVGAFSKVVGTFDFRAFGAGDSADGFAYMLLPTSSFGVSGAGITGNLAVEEPNFANVFAAGFDFHPAPTTNDVSVHFNAIERSNVNINPALINLESGVFHRARVVLQHVNGGAYATLQVTNDVNAAGPSFMPISTFIPGLSPYENRVQFSGRTGGLNMTADLDNVNVAYSNAPLPVATAQNFDSDGTPMHFSQTGAGPGPIVHSGGPSGSFLRLINDGINSQENKVAFAASHSTLNPHHKAIIDFDYRAFGAGDSADGFSMLLIPTATFGTDGVGQAVVGGQAEEPNFPGIVALGFDFHPAATTNDVSLHFGGEIINVNLPLATLNLENGLFNHVHLELAEVSGQVLATLQLTPDSLGVPGSQITVFSNLVIPGLSDLYAYRVQFAGRTGGLNMTVDLDNILASTVPEPATGLLALLGLAGLARRRRTA